MLKLPTPLARRLAVACLALAALPACSRNRAPRPSDPLLRPQPTQPARVLDYRNGWYHTADGKQTVAEIGRFYERDSELVAQLNGLTLATVPVPGRKLYIPPVNDRAQVRLVLERVARQPGLVPQTPWIPKGSQPSLKIEAKRADPPRKQIVSREPVRAGDPSRLAAAAPPSKRASVARPSSSARMAERDAPAPSSSRGGGRAAPGVDSGRFIWPARGEVVTKFKEGWQKACHGIEIAASEGTPVAAARPGKVLLARDFPGYGKMVLIDHGDGFASVYGYASELLVSGGQQVSQGQQIASVGRPSAGAKSKLFFQIRRNAQPVDPLQHLK